MLDLLIVGVCVGATAGAAGAAIGARQAGRRIAQLTSQRNDAWQRIDAIDIRPQPKGQS